MILARPFYMIRHGETEANAARIMAGSTDSPLTPRGREQAKAAARIVAAATPQPVVIIHSNLSRARDTAKIINTHMNVPLHEDPDLAEIHAGQWEGKPFDQCGALLKDWEDPPDGENFETFAHRIRRGKNTALGRTTSPVLIVSHGGVFRAFGKIYGLDVPGLFINCHLYEFEPFLTCSDFPWRIWQHDEQEDGQILRRPSILFHGESSNS